MVCYQAGTLCLSCGHTNAKHLQVTSPSPPVLLERIVAVFEPSSATSGQCPEICQITDRGVDHLTSSQTYRVPDEIAYSLWGAAVPLRTIGSFEACHLP